MEKNIRIGGGMEITAAEKNKKNKNMISVFVDGKYSFSMTEADYLSMDLYNKKELSAEDMEYIKNTVNFRAAKSAAISYLSLKLRTEKEVKTRLLDKGYDHDVIDNVIEELKAMGYINNRLYIQKFIYDRSKLKPKSKKFLRLELLAKGIPSEEIDEVMDDWINDDNVVAEGLLKKKFGKYDMKDENIRKRAYMFLRHRGFSHEIIEGIIGKITSDTE